MTGTVLAARAHAKINLGLRVTATRADGYHELRTVFQSLALHDTVMVVSRRGPLVFRCTSPALPSDASNLVVRAANALWRALGRTGDPAGVEILLDKRIPVGAGLGGGSSDAAAALRALSIAWRARLSGRRLREIAAELGADVPFFLTGGAAIGLGRGDEIYPLADMAATWVVLLVPRFSVLTADAYRWLDADRGVKGDRVDAPPPGGAPGGSLHFSPSDVWNDLEPPVAARHPEIAAMRRALVAKGATAAAMSGSGSTVFGLFASRTAAESAARMRRRSTWTPLVTRAIGRRDYLARAAVGRARRLPASVRIG